MTDLPFVSIGISFYNAENTLLDAVKSVFCQTHKNWELILIDDGSTDNSLEVARSINDPRVRVFSDGENKKLAARLNEISALAKYDFIARMDADDLMSPDRIEKQLKFILKNKEIDLVSTGVLSLSDENEPLGVRCVPEDYTVTNKVMAGVSGIVHASLLGRKSWFERNAYREDFYLAEDAELWARAYIKKDFNVAFIREPLYFYREDGSVTKFKLLRAYKLGRKILLENKTQGFSGSYFLLLYVRSLIKSLTVYVLYYLGGMNFLRSRRSMVVLCEEEIESYNLLIGSVLSYQLPLSS